MQKLCKRFHAKKLCW